MYQSVIMCYPLSDLYTEVIRVENGSAVEYGIGALLFETQKMVKPAIEFVTWFMSHVCSDNSMIRLEKIEHYVREDLNKKSRRVMVVLKPLKVIF